MYEKLDVGSGADQKMQHLQGHLFKKDPDISEELIHQVGFTARTICNSILVTARRNCCTTYTSSLRMTRNSTKSSCTEARQTPASPACTEHSESSQVSSSPISLSKNYHRILVPHENLSVHATLSNLHWSGPINGLLVSSPFSPQRYQTLRISHSPPPLEFKFF